MTGFFHKSLKNLTMLLLGSISASFVLFACSGKVTDNAELGWKVEVIGGAQVTLPRRPFGNPVEIRILDVSGQPVADAVMEYRLVEAKELGSEENVSADVLAKTWDTPKAAMTSSDSAVKTAAAEASAKQNSTVSNADGTTTTKKPEDEIEESVGRIEQFDARTNREGKARVWLFAPTGFNKKIAVIAKAGRDAKFKPIYSHAILSTSDTKGGARLTLSTTGVRKEKAGEEFDIWLNVRDNADRIATSFEGVKTVKFEATPQTSWGGFKPEFPSGEVTCEFTGGRCLIPKGPFILRVPEELNVTVSLLDNSLEPVTDKITVTSDNARKYIALKNTPGRPTEQTTRYEALNMLPGGVTELYAAWMDANGNYLEDLVSATWALDSPRLAEGMSSTTGARITFAPTKTGTGWLSVTSDNVMLRAPIPVIVPANEFIRWAFRINGAETQRANDGSLIPPIVKAGACVDVDLYASDMYGNIVPTVKGEHEITLKIENASTGIVLAKDAHWGDLQPLGADLTNRKVVLNEGLARSVEKACFYDATRTASDTLPVLTASGRHNIPNGANYTGALNINVQKNIPYKIILTRAKHNARAESEIQFDNAVNVCTRFTNETSNVRPCLVMQAGSTEEYRAAAVDVAGNFIKYVEASLNDTLANTGAISEATEVLNNVSVKRYSMIPARAGDGTMTVSCTSCSTDDTLATISAANRTIEYSYQIVSKNPSFITTHLDTNVDDQLTGADDASATAGSSFKVIAKLVDIDGNFVNKKRVEITNNLHFSQHYYESSSFDANVAISQATITSPTSCHRYRANTPTANLTLHQGTVDNLNGVNAELRSGLIRFNGNNDEFKLMRATNTQNGNCTPTLNMTVVVTVGNNANTLTVRNPNANTISVKAQPNIAEVRFKNAEDNGGVDLNDNADCRLQETHFRNAACHEILVRGVARTLHIAAYDQFRNFIRSDEANNLVKYRWFNTPTLDNYNTAENQAKTTGNNGTFSPSQDVAYDLSHTTNLTQDVNSSFSTEKNRLATVKLSESLPADKSPTGAGFLVAYLDSNPNIQTHSVVYNFSSEIATRFVVDFIEPDKATDPAIYWSSAYGQPTGNAADSRQLLAGQEFSIRIRPVDNANNGVKSYRDTKNIRITIPEYSTWGEPTLRSVQATETNTPTGGTTQIDVQCDFQVPVTGKYTGSVQKIGVNYTVTGPYSTGSECIVKNTMGTADRRFSLLNNLNQYTIYATDLNPTTTINNPVILIAQPIVPAASAKKLNVADRCGGPPAALLWNQSQTGVTKSTSDNTVRKIGSGASAKFQITADERLDLFPVFTDLFGNYISDAGNATLSELRPTGVTTTNTISDSTPQTGCKKFSFTANTATNHLTNPVISLSFSDASVVSANSLSIPLEVVPGEPNNLNVRLLQPRTSASDPEVVPAQASGVTEVEAGSCFSPSIKVMDADGNQVRSFASAVTVNMGLLNYYDETNEDTKELIHPGGLYKYSRLNTSYFPITSLDNGHETIPTIANAGNASWLTAKSYKKPSEMDERDIFYFGSEKSDRLVAGGELNIIDRYICLMDASTGLRPNLRVALDIDPTDTTRYIFGESSSQQDVRVRAGPATVIDFREVKDAVRGRLCQQSSSKVGFPVLRVLNQEPSFTLLTTPTCRPVRVSNSPFKIAAYFTDKVGNYAVNGSFAAGNPVGSWNISQAPLDASVCNVLNATGSVCSGAALVEFTGLTKKGTIAGSWVAPAGISGDYGSTAISVPVRSGDAERLALVQARDTLPTTDETFGLNVKLQDGFGNDYDPPVGFTYAVTGNITYTGLFSTDAGTAPPNGDTSIATLKPTTAALQFSGSNIASTGNIFRIRRANGSTAAGIQISLAPASGLSAVAASLPLTILPGAAYTNEIYYSDTSGAKQDQKLLSLEANNSNVNPLTAGSGKQQIEVRALDRAGNIASSPAVNFAYVGTSSLAPLQPHPSLTYSAYIPLNLAGVGVIQATLVGSTTKTQQYKVSVSPANASKLKLVRVQSATDPTELASNTPLVAGGNVFFKILATDDQDNLVDQFNRSNVNIQWNFGSYPQRSEGGRAVLPGCSTDSCATPVTMTAACQFVGGVCRQGSSASDQVKIFTARLLGATGAAPGILEAKADTDNGYTGTFGVNVNPGAFHHFGVIPSVTEVEARADKTSKFSVDVEARDEFGNKLLASNSVERSNTINTAPISLIIRREDGTSAASGSLDGLPGTAPSLSTADSVRFDNLAYDEPGIFRILARSTNDLGLSTVAATPAINFRPVEATISRYRLVFGAGVNEFKAGQESNFRLEAVDNYNNPVRGIDSILRSHVYVWGGLSGAATVNGMSRPADDLPTQFNTATKGQFIDGVANFKGTLHRAASDYLTTLTLNNTKTTANSTADDSVVHLHPTQLTTGSSTGNISSIIVVPAELKQYNVIATANTATTATSLAANTNISADSTNGLFRILVQPLDPYGNLRKGEAGITLTPDKGNSSLNATVVRRLNDPTFAVNPLNLTSDLATGSAGYSFDNLFYRVAQPVSWKLTGTGAGINVVQSQVLNYTATLDSVNSYQIKINNSMSAANITAGTAFELKLEALDEANNIVTGIDAQLSNRSFTVAGPEAIGNNTPTSLNSFSFNAGVAARSGVQFFKSQTFLPGTLALSENGSSRVGKNAATLTITPANVSSLAADPIAAQKAGTPFKVTVRAKDQYGNPTNTNCADPSNNSTFPITMKGVLSDNTTADKLSSSGDGGGTITDAFQNAAGVQVFRSGTNTGLYEADLTLFKKGENRLRFEGCGQSSVSIVMLNESDKANVMRLNNSSAAPASDLASELECNHTNTTGKNLACPTIYAFLWDRYGNPWRSVNDGVGVCNWTYTNLVPDTPISAAGTVSGINQNSLSQTLVSDAHMSGNLRCEVAAANSESNNKLYKDVRLYGGLAGLGGRGANDALVTTGVTTEPTNLANIQVGNNNLRITKVTLLQYRGGLVAADGSITSRSSLLETNRARTEQYSFTPTNTIPASAMPTSLVKNHDTNGNMDGEFSFSFNNAVAGNITITARGVSTTLSNISVGVGTPVTLKVGRFKVGTEERQSVVAGEPITLDSIEVLDASGNRVCNGTNTATIESSEIMVPAVCGTDLNCANKLASLPGGEGDFATYALRESGNRKSFTQTATGLWTSAVQFKLYRTSLAFRVTVRACGLSSDYIFSVGAAPVAHARLAASENPPDASTTTPEIKCPLGDGLGVRCPTIRAFTWDQYGNRNTTGNCTAWGFDAPSTSNTAQPGAGFTLAASNTDRTTISTTNANYLSGRLKCTAASGIEAGALVYGGLTSIQANHTFGGSAGATTAVAAANNFEITKVTARFKKPRVDGANLVEDEIVKDDFAAGVNETITFTSGDARTLTDPVLPIASTSTSFGCTFAANGECIPAANTAVLSFRKVESARSVNLNLRGRSIHITGLTVTPRGAHSMQVGLYTQVANEATKITVENPLTAGVAVGAKVKVFDEFNNPTSILKNQTVATQACVPAATDITGAGLDASNSRLTDANRLLTKNAEEAYEFGEGQSVGSVNGYTINKAGTHTLTFRACGLDPVTLNVKVVPAAHAHTRVSRSATPPATPQSATMLSERCTLNAQGSGADCGMAYAWFYDAFYNRIADDLSCTDWVYSARDTAHDSDPGLVTRSITAASATTRVTSSDFMDGELKCDFANNALDASIHLYGGIHSVEGAITGNPATVIAGEGNVVLSRITLYGPSYDAAGANYSLSAYPVALSGENIALSTTATASALGTTKTVVTPSFKCNFGANGECTTPTTAGAFAMNFTKAETARTITLSARGKSWTSNAIDVTPARASPTFSTHTVVDNSDAPRANNNVTADELFGIHFFNKDAFGNPTDLNDAGAACSATNSTTSNDPIGNNPNDQDAFVLPADTNNKRFDNTVGSYLLKNLKISKAGNAQTITFTTCGISRPIAFNVSPGAANKFVLNQSTSVNKTPVDSVQCATLNGSGGATCTNVYAYFYDAHGNHRANDTCDGWTLTKITGSAAPNPPWLNQGGSSSIQVASLNAFDATLTCVTPTGVTEIGTAGIHLYGGFSLLEMTAADSRDGDGKITAANNNFTVNTIKLKSYINGTLQDAQYTGSFQVIYSTNASPAPNGTVFTTTPNEACNFTNGLCNTAKSFTFAKADDTARTLTVSIMGISATTAASSDKLTTIRVAPAAANSANSSHTLLDSNGNVRANNSLTTDDTFGLNLVNKDEFDNLTNKNTAGVVCNSLTTFTETIAANPKGGDSFIDPAGANNTNPSVGRHEIRNMRISLVGNNHAIKFTSCGVERNLTFNVSAGAAKTFYVTDATTASKADQANSIACTTLNEGGGATCPNVYAYFYDDYDNQRINDTCDKWTLTDKSANTTRPWAEQSAAASVQVTSFSALDSDLACVKNIAGTNQTKPVHVYGGFKQLKVTTTANWIENNTYIIAAANNFRVNQVTLRGYRNGTLVDAPHAGSHTITFSTDASDAPDGTKFTTSATAACSFTNGLCTLNKDFTFARADDAAKSLTVSVKGIITVAESDSAKLTAVRVKPSTPTSMTTNLPSSVVATATFGGKVELFDAFKNPSCDTVTVTMPATADTQAPNGTTATAPATLAAAAGAPGVFNFAATAFNLPKVSSTGFNIGFSGCSSGTFNHLVKVSEGSVDSVKILAAANQDAAQVQAGTSPTNISCKHTATSGNGVVCDTVYAYLLDGKGNLVTDATKQCTWTYTKVGDSTVPATLATPLTAGRQLSITHTAFLDGSIKCTADNKDSTSPTVQGGISRVALKLAKGDAVDIDENSTTATRTVTAGNDNVGVHRIQLYTKAGGNEVQLTSAQFAFTAEPLEFVTTAVKSVMTNAKSVIPANPTCNFSTAICGTGTDLAGTPVKLSLTRSGGAGMSDLAVKVRGVTSNNIPMLVNAGTTTTVTVNPVGTQVAGTQFDVELKGFDAQENPSWTGCTAVTMTGGQASLTGPGNTALAPAFTQPTVANNVATAKVTLYASGNHQLLFTGTGCNFTTTTTVAVNAAGENKTIVSQVNANSIESMPTYSANDEATATEVACTQLNADNNGVTCPTLYAYKYDSYGNKTTNGFNGTCTWQAKAHPATSYSSWVSSNHSATRSSNSTTPSIDELVKCDGGNNHVRLYGGPAKLTIATIPPSTVNASGIYVVQGAEILAGLSNLVITDVALKSTKAGTIVEMPGLAGKTDQNINIVNVDFANNTFGANANSDASAATITQCAFNGSGECFPSANMNFRKTEDSAKKFRVTVRGVSSDLLLPQVKPGPAANLEITGMPSNDDFSIDEYTDQNTSIALSVTAKDLFGNTTAATSNGAANCNLSVSGNEPGPYADNIAITNNTTSSQANLKIYKAKTHTLAFSKCGATATKTLTITAGKAQRSMLTRQPNQPAIYNCVDAGDNVFTARECTNGFVCAAGNPAGGAGCSSFYAWSYDKAGNLLSTTPTACDANDTNLKREFTKTGNSDNVTFTNVTDGFTATASNGGYIEGKFRCKTKVDGDELGGRGFIVLAPATKTMNVECTPWIYGTGSAPQSLCTFKNDTGVSLKANPFIPEQTVSSEESLPTLTLPTASVDKVYTHNSYGQFIVSGTNSKKSGLFKVNFESEDPSRVLIQDSGNLRVPLRADNDLANVGAATQQSAKDAGTDLSKAEQAEVAHTDNATTKGKITINAVDFARRTWLYGPTDANMTWNNASATNCLNGLPATGTWKCLKDMTIGTRTVDAVTDISTGTTIFLRDFDSTNTRQQDKINIFDTTLVSLNSIFVIEYPATTNTDNCSNDGEISKNTATACKFSIRGSADHPGIRGAFWIKDKKGRVFYFMTSPIP